jgi:GT2 family glycosyltransferase
MTSHFEQYRQEIAYELGCAESSKDVSKDILVAVHDQLDYLRVCVESVRQHTRNYRLYIWDNASAVQTERYLQDLVFEDPDHVEVTRSEANLGFVEPNNRMAAAGQGDYLILLNSDTRVKEGWDRGLGGFLQRHPDVAQVGYVGGLLDSDGMGGRAAFGYDIDYVIGYCTCVPRAVYREFGLFDPSFHFAYFEDADFSLRLLTAGRRIYSLHSLLVDHFPHQTVKAVHNEGVDLRASFVANHTYFRQKWADYLRTGRVDVRFRPKD